MEQPEQKIKLTLPETTVAEAKQDDAFTGTPVFDAKNVSIYYSAFRAVTDVSLTIYENEITAFIGPSGCGKTTVLRTLNRMNDLIVGARVEGDITYRGASLYERGVSPTAVRRTRSRSRSTTTSPTGRGSTASAARRHSTRSSSGRCARPPSGMRSRTG
jgi:ABC-type glutathione transport system ATPase component